MRNSWVRNHNASTSYWLVALSHSTTTVPLKADARAGRRTTMRVLYGWPDETMDAVGEGVGRAPMPGATVASYTLARPL